MKWPILVCAVVVLGPACGPREERAVRVAAAPAPARGMPLPLPARRVARLLREEPFELADVEEARGGVTRVDRARARFPAAGVALPVKWKVAPPGGEGWNNVPRKELAAFVIQQWFLEPVDWLVPPTSVRCVPVEAHRAFRDVDPIVGDTRCVLGTIAAWLGDVRYPEELWDDDRFRRDATYARHRADLNLLLYLIDHRDGRRNNFVVPEPDDGRIFAVDNGISFGGWVWNYFAANWNRIRVPALRRDAVERLRRIDAGDVSALLVLAELRADARGVLEPVPAGAPWDAGCGARLRPGHVQMGLTADETAGLATRVQRVLARVDAGEIPLF